MGTCPCRIMSYGNYGLKIPWGHKAGQQRFVIGRQLYVKVASGREAMPIPPSLQLIYTDGRSSLCHLPNYQHDLAPSPLQLQHSSEPVLTVWTH